MTDRNDAKKYLNEYRGLYEELCLLENRLEGIQSPTYSDMPRTRSQRDVNARLDRKNRIEMQMLQIENKVSEIPDAVARAIIEYHFFDQLTIEATSRKINYSMSQTYRYYSKGLDEVASMI